MEEDTDPTIPFDARVDHGVQFRARYGRYVTWCSANGTFGCSCPAFHFRPEGACKHVLDLVMSMTDLTPQDFVTELHEMSGMSNLVRDDLAGIPGGLPLSTITGLFGKPGAGKTTLVAQSAMAYIKQHNRPAIIVDTEGSTVSYFSWYQKLRMRWDMPDIEFIKARYISVPDKKNKDKRTWEMVDLPKKVGDNSLIVIDCRNIRGILHMHGKGVNMKVRASKLAFLQDEDTWDDDVWNSPIAKVISSTNAGYLSYDSISMPMKEIGIENQNLPQRAEVTAFWMAPAQQLFHELSLCGFATLHYMKDPANIYGPVEFEGGKAAGHTYKYVFQLDKAGQGAKETRRKLAVWRHPGKKPYSETAFMELTETGFVDVEAPATA